MSEVAHRYEAREKTQARTRPGRARFVLALGPLTILAGLAWAVLQPDRLTILHPDGQGLWWLISEPPLYVIAVGVLFRVFLAPGIAADVEKVHGR